MITSSGLADPGNIIWGFDFAFGAFPEGERAWVRGCELLWWYIS